MLRDDFLLSSWIHYAIMTKQDVIAYCREKSNGELSSSYIAEIYKTYFELGSYEGDKCQK